MNKSNHRSPFAIVGRLIVLVKPMLPIMLAAIVMGVAGHFCATFITIFGGLGILRALGLASPSARRIPKPPKMVMKVAQKWPATPITIAASMMGSMGFTSTISRPTMAKGLR